MSEPMIEFLLARIEEDAAEWVEHEQDGDWSERFTSHLLRECEAKRRIVFHARWAYEHGFNVDWDPVRHLAAVYRDHPDYDESSWWTGQEEHGDPAALLRTALAAAGLTVRNGHWASATEGE